MVHQGPCPVPAGEGVPGQPSKWSQRAGHCRGSAAAADAPAPPAALHQDDAAQGEGVAAFAEAVGCTLRYGALMAALEDTGHDARPHTQRPCLAALCVPPVCIGSPLYKNPLGVSPQVSHPYVSPSPHTRRTPTPSTHLHTNIPTRPLVRAATYISKRSTRL